MAEALDLLHKQEKPSPGSREFARIAKAQMKLGDREGAKQTFLEAVKIARAAKLPVERKEGMVVSYGTSSIYNVCLVAHIQAESGDKASALETLRPMLQALPDAGEEEMSGYLWIRTLATLAKEFAELDAMNEARQVIKKADAFYETLKRPIQDELPLPQLAAVHVSAGDIEGAFALVERVEQGQEHPIVKQSIIDKILGEMAENLPVKDREQAKATINRIKKKFDTLELAEVRYNSGGKIARALAEVGDVDMAMKVARQIGEGPTRVDYDMRDGKSHAMMGIAWERRKAGDLEGSRQTFREALKLAKPIDESRGRSGLILMIAGGMLSVDDISGALICAEDLAVGRRAETLKRMALAQQANGDEAGARSTFAKALTDASYHIDHPLRQGVDTIEFKMGMMDDAGHRAVAMKELADIQAASGDFESARKTAGEIPVPNWRASAVGSVAKAQAASGDAEGALAWVRTFKDLSRTLPSPLQLVIEGAAGIQE